MIKKRKKEKSVKNLAVAQDLNEKMEIGDLMRQAIVTIYYIV